MKEVGRLYYTKALGKEVAAGARPETINIIHVITGQNNTWSVVVQGSLRALRSSLNKREAIAFAKITAKKKMADYIAIHNKNGYVDRRIYMKGNAILQ
jgi:hypothetical protein